MSGYVNARVDIEIDGDDIMQGIMDDVTDVARETIREEAATIIESCNEEIRHIVREVVSNDINVESEVKDVLNDFDFTDEIIDTIDHYDFSDVVLSEVMRYDYDDEIEQWVVSQLQSFSSETEPRVNDCRLGKAFKSAVNQIVDERIESRRKTGVDELASLQDSHANLQRQVMALTKGMNAMHKFLSSSSSASDTAISTWKGAQANVMGYHND
jgi:hypothetical protein